LWRIRAAARTSARRTLGAVRAITIPTAGGPDALVLTELPDPVPGPGEVRIHVAAAGVNRADLLQRQGRYPPPPGAPQWPGLECSGVIGDVGPGVEGWHVGDRVAALLDGGGYAEQVLAPVHQLLSVPDGVDLVDAAGLPEAVCTAWSNLILVGRLRAGETALIHGGSGGVGTVAIQLAAATGARVAVTAGGAERVGRCRALGADIGIDHRAEDFVTVLREATQGRGADVILDVVGAAYLERNLDAAATDGRLVVIGLQKGRRAELDLGVLLAKRVSVHGTTLRARPAAQKAAIVAEVADKAWPMLDDGRLRPVIHARLPLADAARAHELLDSGAVFGKLLLTT
jgi:putative PIG3 family NAD(P)H quinone oxidoreductase